MAGPLASDENDLPWLAAVDDLDEAPRVSGSKMLAALAVVLLGAALVAGTFFWIGRKDPVEGGRIELIRAPDGPYKVRPDDPGGLDIAGDSETAFATGAGVDTDAQLDPAKLGPDQQPLPEEASTPEPKVAPKPEPKAEEPAPVAGSPTIQLGAYGSSAKADLAWTMLSSRFPEVAAMRKQIVSANVGGKTVVRLRASGSKAQTDAACSALKAGGESCLVVN